jgi:hypothetical protein
MSMDRTTREFDQRALLAQDAGARKRAGGPEGMRRGMAGSAQAGTDTASSAPPNNKGHPQGCPLLFVREGNRTIRAKPLNMQTLRCAERTACLLGATPRLFQPIFFGIFSRDHSCAAHFLC